MQGEKQDYVALTTLRAIGALCVVEHHAWYYVYPAWSMNWFFAGVQYWPDYFFVLSGFILTHVYGQSLQKANGNGVYNYLVARIARVYPLHLFMIVVLFGFELFRLWVSHHTTAQLHHPVFAEGTSLKYLPSNLLLIQSWGIHHLNTWNDPAWSVSAEFACYLLFPFVVRWHVLDQHRSALLFGVLCVAGLLWVQLTHRTFHVTYDAAVPRAFFSFGLGCLIRTYLVAVQHALRRLPPTFWQCLAILLCCVLFAWKGAKGIYFIPVWVLLIASLTFENTPVSRALSWKPFVTLGDISYSIYLIHIGLLWAFLLVRDVSPDSVAWILQLPPPVTLAGLFAIVIGLSYLTYEYVENPGRRFVRQHFSRKSAARVAEAAARRPAAGPAPAAMEEGKA